MTRVSGFPRMSCPGYSEPFIVSIRRDPMVSDWDFSWSDVSSTCLNTASRFTRSLASALVLRCEYVRRRPLPRLGRAALDGLLPPLSSLSCPASGPPCRTVPLRGVSLRPAASACRLDAAAQRVHQVDDVARLGALWRLDRLTFALLANELAQGIFIMILEFFGMKMAGFRFDDVLGQLHHVPGELDVPY